MKPASVFTLALVLTAVEDSNAYPVAELSMRIPTTLDLTGEEIKALLKTIFANTFDKDGDGAVTKDELGTALGILGMTLTEAQLQDVMKLRDADDNGALDFEEFLDMITFERVDTESEEDIRADTFMKSAKFLDFWIPSLPLSAFGSDIQY